MKKTPREVQIRFKHDTWFVCYASRKKGQWHTAAGFYAPDHTLEWVKEWVAKQPHLKLI